MKTGTILACILTTLLLAGCSLPTNPSMGTSPTATRLPFAPTPGNATPDGWIATPTLPLIVDGDGYPQTPEGVVMAFLDAYTESVSSMPKYMTSGLRAALPESDPAEILGFKGALEGYAVQSASISPDPPVAQVEVAMQVNGEAVARRFKLLIEDRQWRIDAIEPI